MICFTSSYAAPAQKIKSVKQICSYTGWDCSKIKDPEVIESPLVNLQNMYGVFFPSQSWRIYLATSLSPAQYAATGTHETVHYILYKLNPRISKCESEMKARKITSLIHNYPYDETWRRGYGCPK